MVDLDPSRVHRAPAEAYQARHDRGIWLAEHWHGTSYAGSWPSDNMFNHSTTVDTALRVLRGGRLMSAGELIAAGDYSGPPCWPDGVYTCSSSAVSFQSMYNAGAMCQVRATATAAHFRHHWPMPFPLPRARCPPDRYARTHAHTHQSAP